MVSQRIKSLRCALHLCCTYANHHFANRSCPCNKKSVQCRRSILVIPLGPCAQTQKNESDPELVKAGLCHHGDQRKHTRERQASELHGMAAVPYQGVCGTWQGSDSHKWVYLKPVFLGAVWVANIGLLSHRKEKLILNWSHYEPFQRNLQRWGSCRKDLSSIPCIHWGGYDYL